MLLEQRAKLRQESRDYQKACFSRSVTSTPDRLYYPLPLLYSNCSSTDCSSRRTATYELPSECVPESLGPSAAAAPSVVSTHLPCAIFLLFQDVGTAIPLHKSHQLSSGTVWLANGSLKCAPGTSDSVNSITVPRSSLAIAI